VSASDVEALVGLAKVESAEEQRCCRRVGECIDAAYECDGECLRGDLIAG